MVRFRCNFSALGCAQWSHVLLAIPKSVRNYSGAVGGYGLLILFQTCWCSGTGAISFGPEHETKTTLKCLHTMKVSFHKCQNILTTCTASEESSTDSRNTCQSLRAPAVEPGGKNCFSCDTLKISASCTTKQAPSQLVIVEADNKLRNAAATCEDERIAISSGNLIAREVHYHKTRYHSYTRAETLACVIIKNSEALSASQPLPDLVRTHEEVYTRLLLHAKHVACAGCTHVTIKTPDTDTTVPSTAFCKVIPTSLSLLIGAGSILRRINVNAASNK